MDSERMKTPKTDCALPASENKLVSRSSRKATVAKTVLIGQAQVLRSYAKPSR